MAILIAYFISMKTANIAEFKNKLGQFIALIEQGEIVQICKRNIPIARLVPVAGTKKKNRTNLGCGLGSVKINGDLTEPMIPEDNWDMLR